LPRRYFYNPDGSPLSLSTTAGDYNYLQDGLGSTANLVSASGASEWTYSYEPFGAIRSFTKNDPNAPANPLQFTGQYLDSASGLYDLRARQYDPTAGSFLSPDPAPYGASTPYQSGYGYADGNPNLYVDPAGARAEGGPSSINGLSASDDNWLTAIQAASKICAEGHLQACWAATAYAMPLFWAHWRAELAEIEQLLKRAAHYAAQHPVQTAAIAVVGFVAPEFDGVAVADEVFGAGADLASGLAATDQGLTTSVGSDFIAEDGGAIARDFSLGDPGEGALGSTDKFGNITIRPGLSDQAFAETLRHETVHSILSPSWEPLADARMWLYGKSGLYRYAEEALAEGYAVRNIGRGLAFPLANGYVSPLRLGLELGGVGAAAYGAYEVAK
jgi:RHS repeat-associated protein